MIDKGFISSIDEIKRTAVVVPISAGAAVTHDLVIPYFLRDCLQANMPVVYAAFEDNTGIILARMDGEWNHQVYDNMEVNGILAASDDVKVGSISLTGHTHGYTHGGVSSGTDTTSVPK